MDKATQQKILEVVGTQTALAEALGRRQQTVNEWFLTGRVPAHHVLRIVDLTSGAVTPQDLRPDVFGSHTSPSGEGVAEAG